MRDAALILLLVLGGIATSPVAAQSDDGSADDAAKSGLVLPAQGVGRLDLKKLFNARPKPPKAPTTYVRGDGGALVAKVLAEIGDERLIKLPTGELEVVQLSDTRPTDRPFRSATRQQVIDHFKSGDFAEFTFIPSGYYIFAHQGSEAFLAHTKSIMETLLPGVVEQLKEWGIEAKRPETPMVVIIMPSRAAFDALEPMPQGVAAYYSNLKNYVVLYEDTRLWEAAPEYAFKSAAYTVAHEGIHQILANTGVQQRLSDWPAWISEGLPEYFCPLKVSSRLIKHKDGELPERTLRWQRAGLVNDLRMHHLLRVADGSGTIARRTVSTGSLNAYGYATSWGLVHYLESRKRKQFAAYIQEVAQTKPLMKPLGAEQTGQGPDPLFVKHFGEDFREIEAGLRTHLTSPKMQKRYRDPIIYQTAYVLKSTIKRGRNYHTKLGITLSPDEAKKWKQEQKAIADAEGRDIHVTTVVCKNLKEARYHFLKAANR